MHDGKEAEPTTEAEPTAKTELTTEERDWIMRGMAWVGLRHWLCGAVEAETARVWFQEQMDVRFCARTTGRHITPDMVRLEADFGFFVLTGLPAAKPVF